MNTVRIQGEAGTVDQFRSHRAVALLVYLVCQPQAVPRSELVELIWPDNPERGRANLRWVLSYLNKLLPGCWETTRQTAQFQPQADCWVDVLALQAALAADNVAALATAVSHTHGEFCRGFYFNESPEFETWLLTQREHWQRQLSLATQRLIDHHNQLGEYGRALTFARKLLALDTWQEHAHRQVMLLLARSGDFNGALAQYERCRQILADELHIDPTQATAALAERIRALRERPRHNLPPQPTLFVGREAELAELTALLAAPENRLVTIVAAGGMGKTRLATAVAAGQTGTFLDGVAFVSLAPITSPALLATTMVEALGSHGFIEPHQSHKLAADYLLDALTEKELLLVLDNYEQLLPDISLLLAMLARAPQVKLLVTSRERLNTRWERPFPLTGLPYPQDNKTNDHTFSAPQLFLQAAKQARPDFQPSAADQQAIIQICQLVEGMPLALELAAMWMRVQTPAAIAAEIANNLDILHTRQQDLPARQRSMHAVFDQTWARLSAAERQTLAQLSVFRGPFSVDAACQVTGTDWSLLAALVDKSLLRHHQFNAETAVYYEMHELLRQYAASHLAERAGDARQWHGQYYAQLLAGYEPCLRAGDEVTTTLKQMQREIDNIRTAWEWALSARHGDSLNQMLGSMYLFYFLPSLVRDGLAVMAAAAKQLEQVQNDDETLRWVYGRILAQQGSFTWLLHEDYDAAEQLLRCSLAILDTQTSSIELAQALHTLANIIYTRDLPTAQQYWERSLKIYEQAGNLERQGMILRNLCVTAPDYATALTYREQALALAAAGNDRRNEGHLYFIGSDHEYHMGNLQAARELAEKSIGIIRAFDDPPHLILATAVLVTILTAENRFDEARALLQEMQETAEKLSIQWHSLLVELANGRFALAEGRLEAAETRLTAVLSNVPNERFYNGLRQQAFFHLGYLKLAQGDLVAAREQWQSYLAAEQIANLPTRSRCWRAMLGIAKTWLCVGDWETAVTHLQQACDLACAIGAQAVWEGKVRRLTDLYQAASPDMASYLRCWIDSLNPPNHN